jgi:hypothetical protein
VRRCCEILAVFLLAWALAGCGLQATQPDVRSPQGAKHYTLRGQAVRREEGGKVVVIRPEKIQGWMMP